ncbi:MAG: hypothetical protein KC620_01455 [Myxococcales bacterium]|nr:hypothetical protein [Myxococcales bacterium]
MSPAAFALLAFLPDVAIELQGDFVTVAHIRSDTDFDATRRFYDPDGQAAAQAATFFRPGLTLRPGLDLAVFYEAELGWSAWSRTDPGQPNPYGETDLAGITARHHQLWAEWRPDDALAVRIGFQPIADPSRLFLDHHLGAARVDLTVGALSTRFFAGQLPDSTFEGIAVNEDNFVNDSLLVGSQSAWDIDFLVLDAGLYAVIDQRVDDRPLRLGTGLLGVRVEREGYAAWLHVLGQYGTFGNTGVDGETTLLAGAAQLGMALETGPWSAGFGAFALTPDDAYHGNDRQGAFFGSAKNLSPTRFLTEDETRDTYDNLDERLASAWGPFFFDRAGLAVADASASYAVGEVWTPELIVGAGFALEPENALGERFVGIELTWANDFQVAKDAWFFAHALVFVPGGAAAARVNDVDRTATEPLFGGQAGFELRF